MSIDPVSNMLSRIKNAAMARREFIEIPHSNMKESIAKVLKEAGFLSGVKKFKEKEASYKSLRIDIAFENGRPVLNDIKRYSTPGRRYYQKVTELKRIKPEFGVLVISTSKGIMSGEKASKKKLGGEVICEVI